MRLTIEVEVDPGEWALAEHNATIETNSRYSAKDALAKDVEEALRRQEVYDARVMEIHEG